LEWGGFDRQEVLGVSVSSEDASVINLLVLYTIKMSNKHEPYSRFLPFGLPHRNRFNIGSGSSV